MTLNHNHETPARPLVTDVQEYIVTSAEVQPVLEEMLDIFVDMHARAHNMVSFLEKAYFGGRTLNQEAKRHVM